MRRLRAVVQYDGTSFAGFQVQPDQRTVQGELQERLAFVCGHPVEVSGAGRTDAGVHALGQVVHWETSGRVPVERVARAVNSAGPADLLVGAVEETRPEFHARYSATRRSYRYFVSAARPTPFAARYVLYEPRLRPGAAERMEAALGPLVGRHDFAAFCAAGSELRGTVRTLEGARLLRRGALWCVELTADAFLRNMVRIVAGLLLEIGTGRREPEALGAALRARSRPPAVQTAPPHGLFLTRVEYPDGYPGPHHPIEEAWGTGTDLALLTLP